MKTILVTGGAGFIGSNLIKRIIKNHRVICVDNFFTGNKNNILSFLEKENFLLIKQDVIKPIKLPQEEKINEIYHLACPASPPFYQKEPIHTIKTSFLGTLHLANLALKHQAKILFASTSEVYGSPMEHPQKETYWGNVNPNGVRSCYDEGKRAAESLLSDYQRTHDLDIRIVRIFNTYGEKMNPLDGRVVTNFIFQALKNLPLTIYGKGNQTRSFCYVDDLVNGIIKMMQIRSFSENKLKLVNLGNPLEQTILSLATEILQLTKSKSKIIFQNLPLDDPPKRKPDISLAQKELNWHPKTNLTTGLKKTISFIKKLLR